MKKRGFGVGKWNGYGGKVFENESPRTAVARELKEESGLVVSEGNLEQVGLVRFYFDGKQLFECHVFLARSWQEKPLESEEMKPRWFPISQIPFHEMWIADIKWLPLILAGKSLEADVDFSADGSIVKNFSYKESRFS
jgi:ADP-ribose pyrophosphatase YjhB (NUDIX family)